MRDLRVSRNPPSAFLEDPLFLLESAFAAGLRGVLDFFAVDICRKGNTATPNAADFISPKMPPE